MARFSVTIKNSDECMLGGIDQREISMTNVDLSISEYDRQVDEALEGAYDAEYIHEYGQYSGPSIIVLLDEPWNDDDRATAEEISLHVSAVCESIFDNGTFWEGYPNVYTAARARVSQLGFSDSDMDFIFADWPEGGAHYEWLLTVSTEELRDWLNASTPDNDPGDEEFS